MNYVKFLFCSITLAALLFSGCKKTDTSTGPTNTTPTTAKGSYTGVLAGSTSSGIMTLSIPSSSTSFAKSTSAQATVNVTGTVVYGSDSLSVTGTYNTSNDSLYVSGVLGSESFSFAGTYNPANGALSGSWSDSNGDSGNFAATSGAATAVKVYLGTATSSAGHGSAQLDMAVAGTTILGVATIAGQHELFTGTVTNGTTITLTASFDGITGTIGNGTFANGGASASGTYTLLTADNGIWGVALLN